MIDHEPIDVLCIDDDPNILRWEQRCLEEHWPVRVAGTGELALTMAAEAPPAVVICDQDMPGLDGLTVLRRLRARHPETTLLLLTGGADLGVAVDAINDNLVFRFLTKPCGIDRFTRMIVDAFEHRRLVCAERVLLEQTLRGCVKTLIDILAAVNPAAFSRASRAQKSVAAMARHCGHAHSWQIEVAALLSQLGGVILPPYVVEKLNEPGRLSASEKAMVNKIPGVSARLIGPIPRMEEIAEILSALEVRVDGGGKVPERAAFDQSWGARALRVALAADELESYGVPTVEVGTRLLHQPGNYDPLLIDAWHACHVTAPRARATRDVSLEELREGMQLGADVVSGRGLVIVGRGQVVTESILLRLQNFALRDGLPAFLTIQQQTEADGATPAAA